MEQEKKNGGDLRSRIVVEQPSWGLENANNVISSRMVPRCGGPRRGYSRNGRAGLMLADSERRIVVRKVPTPILK